jgi:two-component system, NarL family, sensor histidine kinase UhpB
VTRRKDQNRARRSLFWRIFALNAAVLLVAWAILAFSPAHVESPLVLPLEGAAGFVGLTLMLIVNLIILRREIAPIERLTALMRTADPLRPGPRIPMYGHTAEVVELTAAFNDMLERLERERRRSAGRALKAQEAERGRVARELHDEIGQSLTALLLELEHASRAAPPELAARIESARESARATLEEVRHVAHGLRPEALDDLGLRSALSDLGQRLGSAADVDVVGRIDRHLPRLSPEAELAIYRVAQEALTNSIRHSGAAYVELRLAREDGAVALHVSDDGRGLDGAAEGAGITGMRERALLVGGHFELESDAGRGTALTLRVPAGAPPA